GALGEITARSERCSPIQVWPSSSKRNVRPACYDHVSLDQSDGEAIKQLAMKFRSWGGKRKGAGRKPKGSRPGVPHVSRKQPRRMPALVTMRVRNGLPSLRGSRAFRAIAGALRKGKERFGFRVIHFTVQGNHLHML